jgi:acetyl esterase/lipase
VNDANGERKLLYFPSQTTTPAPCLIVIHSGGWENGRPEEFPLWNHYWARQGYAVAAIEYRLAPHSQWPAPREDVAEALRFMKAQSAKLGIDASRFVLIGRSAGGQIATAAAYTLADPSVRGCVSLYAPADMPFAWQYADPDDVLDSPRLMRQYLGGGATEAEDKYLSSSGTLIAKEGCPPTLMIHGDRDILVWNKQSERLAAKLEIVNVPHYHLALPWATHALDYPFNGPGAQLTRYAIDRFLAKMTQ